MDKNQYLPLLKNALIFKGLDENQIKAIVEASNLIAVEKNDYILRQDTQGTSFFILLEGEAESFHEPKHSIIDYYRPLDVIGQMAAIDNHPRSASVKATQNSRLLAVELDKLSPEKLQDGYAILLRNIAVTITHFLRETNFKKEQLVREKLKAARLSIIIICAICFFAFLLKLLGNVVTVRNEAAFSGLVAVFVLVVLIVLMRGSGYKKEFFGLTTQGWKISLKEGVLFTLPVLALLTLIKWGLIAFLPAFHSHHLFSYIHLFSTQSVPLEIYVMFWSYIFLYILSCPFQELIARGTLQGLLKEFLSGTQKWLYIIGASLIFAMLHLYLSTFYALSALLPGLLWGYLYDRHRSIIGVSVSHMMIGVWVIYVLGLQGILFEGNTLT